MLWKIQFENKRGNMKLCVHMLMHSVLGAITQGQMQTIARKFLIEFIVTCHMNRYWYASAIR